MQGLRSAQGVRSTRHVAPVASRLLVKHVLSRRMVARKQSSVQQLVVEEVESVESVEQQQEHSQMQVVKPLEQQEQVSNSNNGKGKAKQEQQESSDTTSQGSLAKTVPQAKTVRNLVFVTSEVNYDVAAVLLWLQHCYAGLRARAGEIACWCSSAAATRQHDQLCVKQHHLAFLLLLFLRVAQGNDGVHKVSCYAAAGMISAQHALCAVQSLLVAWLCIVTLGQHDYNRLFDS